MMAGWFGGMKGSVEGKGLAFRTDEILHCAAFRMLLGG